MRTAVLPVANVEIVRFKAAILLSPTGFAVGLALLIAMAFPDVVTGHNTFYYRDFSLFGYPLAHFHRQAFWRGEMPLWNPFTDCGIPYLAQWNTMVLYPGAWFYLIFPLQWSLGIFCLIHLFWGGLGMYFLARRWTESSVAGAGAGIAYAFSGLAFQCLTWPNDVAALGWAPWVIGTAELAVSRRHRALFVAALCGAMQMLTGAPEVILLTWVLAAGLFSASVVNEWRNSEVDRSRKLWRSLCCFGALILLVAGVSAAQLLPFRDLLSHSHRDALPHSAGWAMPLWGWANLLAPLFRMKHGCFDVPVQPDQHWTSSYYLGIGPIVLATWAAMSVRNWRVRVLAGAAIGGLLLALGEHGFVYPALKAMIPGVAVMRYPIKCVLLTTLSVPLLAAYGIATWTKDSTKPLAKERLRWLALGAAILTGALVAFGYGDMEREMQWPFIESSLTRIALLGLVVGVLFVVLRIHRPNTYTWACAAIPALFWFDGFSYSLRLSPTAPVSIYEQHAVDKLLPVNPQPRLGQTRAMVSPYADNELQFSFIADPAQHILSRRASLFNNLNLLEEMPKVNGMYSLYPKHEAEVMTRMYARPDRYPERLADFLGVSQVSASTNLFGWELRSSALPLITGGQQPVFADAEELLNRLGSSDFDPQRTVLFSPETQLKIGAIRPGALEIRTNLFAAQEISFEVTSTTQAVVVIAQTYFHWWTCSVDDQPTTLFEANHAFQALVVPAGRHRVELRYRDRSFELGCIVSGVSLLLCVVGCVRSPARRDVNELTSPA